MKLLAIHTIHRNPTGKKAEIVKAGEIFDADEDEAKDLTKLGAVRRAKNEDVARAKDAAEAADSDDDDNDDDTPAPVRRGGRGKKASEEV